MKKIFLFAAAAMVSLSSCVQTDEVYTGGVQEIGFKSGVTRAAVVGTELPAGSAITVAGVWDADGDGAGKYVEYFEPTKFVDASGIYSGQPARYWPNAGKMQFIGYYPNGVGTFAANYGTDGEIAGYKVTGINGTAQNDILYSDLCEVGTVPAATQALYFRHALALLQVNFLTSLTTEEVKIVSATVADVVLGGDLTVTAGGTSNAAWSNPSAAIDHTFANVTDAALTDSANTNATPLLVVPAATQTEMTIVYTLNGHQMTKVVPLATYGAWAAGNKYIYNFSIGANQIQFTCEVKPWTDVVVSGGNITL